MNSESTDGLNLRAALENWFREMERDRELTDEEVRQLANAAVAGAKWINEIGSSGLFARIAEAATALVRDEARFKVYCDYHEIREMERRKWIANFGGGNQTGI